MIIILKPQADELRIRALAEQLEQRGVAIHYSQGTQESLMGLVGDTTLGGVKNLHADGARFVCYPGAEMTISPIEGFTAAAIGANSCVWWFTASCIYAASTTKVPVSARLWRLMKMPLSPCFLLFFKTL